MFAGCIWKCIKGQHFSCLVGTSILIFVIFIIASLAVLVMTVYAYFFFEELDEIVSKNAWSYLIGLAAGVLFFAIHGTISVCLVAKEKGCCKRHKWAIGIFCLLLFLLITVQTLGTFVAMFWVKDSYSFSDGQYTTHGQMEGSADKTRTGIGFIDESLDKAIRDIEAVTCNSYKKCCYSIAQDEREAPITNQTRLFRQSGSPPVLNDGDACDLISDDAGQCNPGFTDPITLEVATALTCTADEQSAAVGETTCSGRTIDCLDQTHADNNELKLCEKTVDNGGNTVCAGRTLGKCRPTIVDADDTFTCVASR